MCVAGIDHGCWIEAAKLKLPEIAQVYQKHNYSQGHQIPLLLAQQQ